MRKIKVAQIGIGHDHAEGIFPTLKKFTDVYEIVGVAIDEDEARDAAHKLCHFEGYERLSVSEILENPEIEAVIIETEEKNLVKNAILAAKAGKHIHMDKPGGENLAEFEELIRIVKEKDIIFHMGYMYRYNPAVSRVLEEVRNGEFGKIFSVEGQMGGIYPATPEKRQWLERFGGGIMFFLGCHMIDIVLSCMGKPLNIIPFNKSTRLEGVDADDFGFAVFEYENGTSFVKASAREKGAMIRRQVVITGEKKTVEIKPIEYFCDDKIYTDLVYNADTFGEKETLGGFDRYDEMMLAFASFVRGDKEFPRRYDYELMLYKCILAACGHGIGMEEI